MIAAADSQARTAALSPVQAAPALWHAGDAGGALALCQSLTMHPEALPEVMLLLGVKGLSAAALQRMAPRLFPDGIGDMFVETLARLYARLAVYGYSFPRWRFLSMGKPALLETFGMERLRRDTDVKDASLPDPARDLLGAGFCRCAGAIYIEYRRAYILIASPAAALLIRNNSAYFGRDRLPAPVLVQWSPPPVPALQALHPDRLAGWSALEDVWQAAPDIPLPEKLMRLESLLAMLDAYDASLAQWLLDARGGLAATTAFLVARLASGVTLPVLALLPAQTPPWFPSHTATLTPTLLSEMQALQWGTPPGPLLQPFVQRTREGYFALLTGAAGDFPGG